MNKLEKFKEVLKLIQEICVVLFLFTGGMFFISGIASFELDIERQKAERDMEREVEAEVIEEEPEVIEIPPTREELMFQDFDALSKIEDKKDWYLAYKGFLEDYPEFDRGSTIYDRYTEEEIYLMQRVIETEVYGCDFEAKTHVASVILNRIEGNNNFPDDATTVCTAAGQFVYSRKQISEDTELALEYVAEIEDTTNGALYFNSMEPMESWNGRPRIFTDHVGHSFY